MANTDEISPPSPSSPPVPPTMPVLSAPPVVAGGPVVSGVGARTDDSRGEVPRARWQESGERQRPRRVEVRGYGAAAWACGHGQHRPRTVGQVRVWPLCRSWQSAVHRQEPGEAVHGRYDGATIFGPIGRAVVFALDNGHVALRVGRLDQGGSEP